MWNSAQMYLFQRVDAITGAALTFLADVYVTNLKVLCLFGHCHQ